MTDPQQEKQLSWLTKFFSPKKDGVSCMLCKFIRIFATIAFLITLAFVLYLRFFAETNQSVGF